MKGNTLVLVVSNDSSKSQTTAVAEHTNEIGHYLLWGNVKLLIATHTHWYIIHRRVKEAVHIRPHPDNINRDNGIETPEAWMPMIKHHNSRSDHK